MADPRTRGPRRLMPLTEAAGALGLSYRAARRGTITRAIPSVVIGERIYISVAWVDGVVAQAGRCWPVDECEAKAA